ncbi:peptidase [Luethyella okanaganae]|uniref:Peptidase n=1 Tax=Luethyella okanaganae TaxID=69372 RepID=A0ABW1VJW3_9MICO
MIDWGAFAVVAIAALTAAATVVSTYSLGLRLLTVSGRVPVVEPAAFTDAITVVSPAQAKAAATRARKAAKKSPLTLGQKRLAFIAACACFILCVGAVLYGIYLIVPALHN